MGDQCGHEIVALRPRLARAPKLNFPSLVRDLLQGFLNAGDLGHGA